MGEEYTDVSPVALDRWRAITNIFQSALARAPHGVGKAIEHLTRAIELDPNYAQAYAGPADSYIVLAGYSVIPSNEAFPKAKSAAARALAIDGALAEAHASARC